MTTLKTLISIVLAALLGNDLIVAQDACVPLNECGSVIHLIKMIQEESLPNGISRSQLVAKLRQLSCTPALGQ
jgi:hypothetical protein